MVVSGTNFFVYGKGDKEVMSTLYEDSIGKIVMFHIELIEAVHSHPSRNIGDLDLTATNLMGSSELLEGN